MAARKVAPVRNAKRSKATNKRTALVLLDRDGVCNDEKGGVLDLSMFKLVPGFVKSLSRLNGDNFKVAIITNQPNVAEGTLSIDDLNWMSAIIREKAAEAGIKEKNFTIEVCMHGKDSKCECRKPRPGMIKKVVKHFKLNPKNVDFYIVGDMMRETQTMKNYYNEVLKPAGISARAKTTILLNWKYGRDRGHISDEIRKLATPDHEVRSLDAALKLIQDKEHS